MDWRVICETCPAKKGAACRRPQGRFDIAIVLDIPTNVEAKRGRLLIGDTGRLIKTIMRSYGVNEDQVYVTSALNCIPESRKKETVLRKYMETCRPRLVDELKAIGVKKVLCFGPIGYSAIMSEKRIVRSVRKRGRWMHAYGMQVMNTYAPVLAFADPEWYRDIERDIRKFITTDGRDKYPRLEFIVPETVSDAKEAFYYLNEFDHVAADFETSGFSIVDNRAICLGYAAIDKSNPHAGTGVAINKHLLKDTRVWKLIMRQLNSDQPTVFHNAMFDLQFMFKHGDREMGYPYEPGVIEDTMLKNYLLDERVGKYEAHNLEGIVRHRYDAPDYGIEMGKWLKKWHPASDDEKEEMEIDLRKYCIMDCYYTDRLHPDLEDELREESEVLFDFYNDFIIEAAIALADVQYVGIRIDKDRLLALKAEIADKTIELRERIRDYVFEWGYEGDADEFNPNSVKQMYEFMYRTLAMPPTKTPRRGKLQEGPTSAAVIRILRDKFPEHYDFFGDILAYRTNTKTVGTYVDGLIKRMDSDGRLRTSLLLNGSATGRLSSRGPNLQNIPEVSHIEIDIRACFIPTSDEWMLLESDYSQLELRVAAHLSRDKEWLQVYLDGRDLHQDVAGALYHKPREEVTPYQRWLAKNTVFGAMYGRGAESLALGPEMDYIEKVFGGTRWTLEEAKEYFSNFFGKYKGFKEWIDSQHRTAYKQHYVESAFGRRRRFPFISRNDNGLVRRQSVNMPIQSTASDITLSALIRIHYQLLELNYQRREVVARVILTIHDSVMVECKKKVKEEVKRIMISEMEQNVPLKTKVPFKADVHEADNWSGLK